MKKTKKLVGVALFTAIVVVLQLLGSVIKFGPFSVTLVLIPIVIGTALYGTGAGAFLGLVFGVTVLASGDVAMFLTINPFGAVTTTLLKGVIAGLCAGLIYNALKKKNKYLAVTSAAIVCPVVNTSIFILGGLTFFLDYITTVANNAGVTNVFVFIIMGIGLNFLFELCLNIILSPIIVRLIDLGKKMK